MRLAFALLVIAFVTATAAQAVGAAAPFTPWCGGADESAFDRQPDAVSAFEIHVVYAFPADGIDRFADRVSLIDTDLATMDIWWRGQDSTRTPRFDLASFAGCPSTFGQLDVSSLRLPHEAAFYARDQFNLLRLDLDATGFGDPDKKYLVYYDGPPLPSGTGVFCGQSDSRVTGGGRHAYSIVYLGGFCGETLGLGGATAVIATHELIHGLSALTIFGSPGPPHACPGDPGHPCDSPNDILYPSFGSSVTLDSLTLDVARDDYYGHSGPWWDVQDSPFLTRLDSPDQAPPSAPAGLTATSRADTVLLSWQASADDVGPVTYRVYRDGDLIGTSGSPHFQDDGADARRANHYAVRAADAVGFLSTRVDLRFRVGLGIVDEAGSLVRDTVPPPAVDAVRARATRTAVILSWRGVSDAGGLRGYRVQRNGVLYALVLRPSVTIPRRRRTAHWTIRAVDRAGNLGPPGLITVR